MITLDSRLKLLCVHENWVRWALDLTQTVDFGDSRALRRHGNGRGDAVADGCGIGRVCARLSAEL